MDMYFLERKYFIKDANFFPFCIVGLENWYERIHDSYYTWIGEFIGDEWFEYMVPNNEFMGLQGNEWP